MMDMTMMALMMAISNYDDDVGDNDGDDDCGEVDQNLGEDDDGANAGSH